MQLRHRQSYPVDVGEEAIWRHELVHVRKLLERHFGVGAPPGDDVHALDEEHVRRNRLPVGVFVQLPAVRLDGDNTLQ
eukprot:3768455-Pleurochrysis_carterae.AAC.1